MNHVLLSIMRKEFRHIRRDPQTLAIILAWPVIMLFLFGYAITMEMRQIDTAIVDLDHSPQSRAIIERVTSTDFFNVTAVDIPYNEYEKVLMERKARCILVIPQDFAHKLQKNPRTKIQLIIDASDPNAANYISKYFSQIAAQYNFAHNRINFMPFTMESRLLFNPDLKSQYFFVPGLIAVILLLISALLTSIAIVREKELGTMEQILVSPVRHYQIIIGKAIPYTVIGFIDAIIILAVGHFWFKVPIEGGLLLLLGTMIIYIFTGLSFGLLVSTITTSQRVAMMAALVSTILPTIMLSGFIFPVDSMPVIFQYISKIIPATHFLEIIRGIMLKGVGFGELKTQIGYLALIAFVLNAISIRKFKTNLEP